MSQQETQIKDISHSIGDINFQLPILLDSEKRVKMRMVGDKFSINYDGKKVFLGVVPEYSCKNCFFADKHCVGPIRDLAGCCSLVFRWDKTPVIFKEITEFQFLTQTIN